MKYLNVCKRCGRPIVRRDVSSWNKHGERNAWTHIGADGDIKRRCYSASFDGKRWDHSINKKWMAYPKRNKAITTEVTSA